MKYHLPTSKSKEDPQKIYIGGTVLVDHASGLVNIYDQVSLEASDTIGSKETYEIKAQELGIAVKSYRSDNGVYTSKLFINNITTRQ